MRIVHYILWVMLMSVSFIGQAEPLEQAEKVRIAVSARPLFDLLQLLKTENLDPVLIGQYGDHHHKQLRAAEFRILQKSDYVIYIPVVDDAIAKIAKGHNIQQINVADISPNVIRIGSTYVDPHIWLSPTVMEDIVNHIASLEGELIDADEKQKFNRYIQQLYIKQQTNKIRTPKWAVLHPAWGYLERFFDFNVPLFLSYDGDSNLLPKNIQKFRRAVDNRSIRCLILEQDKPDSLLQELAEEQGLRLFILDPLAKNIEMGENSLYILWDNYLDAAKLCQ